MNQLFMKSWFLNHDEKGSSIRKTLSKSVSGLMLLLMFSMLIPTFVAGQISPTPAPSFPAYGPCSAHRWNAGDGWRINAAGKWAPATLSSPSLQPKGIVRCASSAETESQLENFEAAWDPANLPAGTTPIPSKSINYYDMNGCGGSGCLVSTPTAPLFGPTDGEDIMWLNFDMRAYSGSMDFQVVSNQSVGWAVYQVKSGFQLPLNSPFNPSTPPTFYPAGADGTPSGLSGDCSQLEPASLLCAPGVFTGLSGNGWSTLVARATDFEKPANFYIAMWMADSSVTQFPNSLNLVFKARFGCGVIPVIDSVGQSVSCNPAGGKTICASFQGAIGDYSIQDNSPIPATSYVVKTYNIDNVQLSSTTLTPAQLSTFVLDFGTQDDPNGVIFADVCANFADVNTPHNICLTPTASTLNSVVCPNGGNSGVVGGACVSGNLSVTQCTLTAGIAPAAGVGAIDPNTGCYSFVPQVSNKSITFTANVLDGSTITWGTPTTDFAASCYSINTSGANPVITLLSDCGTGSFSYPVSAISTDGCICRDTVCVIVAGICPGPFVLNGPRVSCKNSTIGPITYPELLDLSGNLQYNWSITGGGTFSNGQTTATNVASVNVATDNSGTPIVVSMTIKNLVFGNDCATDTHNIRINVVDAGVISANQLKCPGEAISAITTTGTVCTGTPSYQWQSASNSACTGGTWSDVSGATGASFTPPAVNGAYRLIFRCTLDGVVCADTSDCSTVTIKPTPTCNIDGASAVCQNSTGNTYTSTVSPSGGTVTHSWSITGNGTITAGQTSATVTVSATGAGSFTLTDNITRDGCTSSCTKTVTVNPTPSCNITGADAVCQGSIGNSYTSTVSPSGGTVTHNWTISGNGTITAGQTSATVTVSATGAGSFTLTDNISRDGCTSSCQKVVTVKPAATCNITGPDAVCQASTGNTYTSTVTPSGGTVSHSWSITGNGTIVGSTTGASVSVTATSAGSFTLTDNVSRDGCTSSCQKTVTVDPTPSCNITGADAVCQGSTGNSYTSTVSPSGGTVTHNWSITGNGTITAGQTSATVTVSATGAGSFTLTDNISRNGCTSSCTKTVTVNPTPSCNITGPDAVCQGSTGNTYTSTVSPSGGTVTHSWTISGNGTIGGSTTGSSVTVTATGAGSFTLTDNITREGCTSSCTKTVTVNPTPSCNITGADAVCQGSTGNNYTSTVSPSGGTVTHNWSITGNGTITAGQTSATVTVSATGAGSFTLTDNISRNGCTSSCTKTVTVDPTPSCNITGADAVCQGSTGNNYTSTVSPSGGTVTHNWSITGNGTITAGQTSATVTVSATGAGSFTLTDNISRNGCTSSCTKTVTVDPTPSCNITGADAVCQGSTGNNYTSTVSPSGGTVTHNWSITGNGTITAGQTSATVTVSATGAGSFTLTDNISRNGCTSSCQKTVTVNPTPSCNIIGADAVCQGSTGNTYTSTVSPSGGTVTHNWSITGNGTITAGQTSATVTVSATGAGSFTLTDNISRNGCTSSCQKTVTVNPTPSCNITGADAVCQGSTGNTYTSTVSPSGGTVTHSWSISGNGSISGPVNGASVTVSATGAGNFTLTDNITRDGCASSCTKTVTVDPTPTCSISGEAVVCSNESHDYVSTVLPAGGIVTHNWSITGNGMITAGQTSATVTVMASGSGSFTLTDNITRNGCTSSCTYTVTVNFCGAFCSYTQGYYGSWRGKSCDGVNRYDSAVGLILSELGTTDLIIGVPGVRSVTVPASLSGAQAVNRVMPGGKTPRTLPDLTGSTISYPVFINNPTQFRYPEFISLQGRINNNFLSQLLALKLNARMNGGVLGNLRLQSGYLVTQKRSGCSTTATPVPCSQDENTISSRQINSSVVNYLAACGGIPKVSDFLSLADSVIAGVTLSPRCGVAPPSLSAVHGLCGFFNEVFDGCRAFVGYFPCAKTCDNINLPCTATSVPTWERVPVSQVKVEAFPNPYFDQVNFVIKSPVAAEGSLKVYNAMGQLVSTVFQGAVPAGKSRNIQFKAPVADGSLFYIYEQNGQKVTGKLIKQ